MESRRLLKMVTALVVLALVLTVASGFDMKYKGCHERWMVGERKPGVYKVYPNLNFTNGVQMLCNHTDAGSSVLIQQRVHGSVSFDKPFAQYKQGFGHISTDYWAGLDLIYHLTITGYNRLTINMYDWNGRFGYITYGHFSIQDQSHGYRLSIGYPSGNVPDDLSYHNGMYFYTYDYPDQKNCARQMRAGWWYNYCAYALLNGRYYYGGPYTPPGGYYDGIFWKDWLGYGYSLKTVRMYLSK